MKFSTRELVTLAVFGALWGLVVDFKAVTPTDTLHGRIATSWKGDGHGWRIVRQTRVR